MKAAAESLRTFEAARAAVAVSLDNLVLVLLLIGVTPGVPT
jgi:hypothetical protein